MDELNQMIGQKIVKIDCDNDSFLNLTMENGDVYEFHHDQSCCECVRIERVFGDLNSLLYLPIIAVSLEQDNENPTDINEEDFKYQDSFTWTYLTLATEKSQVTVRWYGESNGYYSENVDFFIKKKELING